MKFPSVRTLSLALVAFLLAALGLIVDEVTEGDTLQFDQAFLLSLREPGDPTNPIGPTWLEEVARDITALGGVVVLTLLTTLVTIHFMLRGKPRSGLLVAVAAISGTLISNILKVTFDRPRPELTAIMEYGRGSFPSGHSTMAAVVYLTLGVMLAETTGKPSLKAFYLATAGLVIVLVGLSRLYLGVHYPTDVAAGWMIGASWAIICGQIAAWLKSSKKIERSAAGNIKGAAVTDATDFDPRTVNLVTVGRTDGLRPWNVKLFDSGGRTELREGFGTEADASLEAQRLRELYGLETSGSAGASDLLLSRDPS